MSLIILSFAYVTEAADGVTIACLTGYFGYAYGMHLNLVDTGCSKFCYGGISMASETGWCLKPFSIV